MFAKIFRSKNNGLRQSSPTEKEGDGTSSSVLIPPTSTVIFQPLENVSMVNGNVGRTLPDVDATVESRATALEAHNAGPVNMIKNHRAGSPPRLTSQRAASPKIPMVESKYVPFVDSTLMKERHTARPGYGQINPAILGGFDDFDGVPEANEETSTQMEWQQIQPRPTSSTISANGAQTSATPQHPQASSHYKPVSQLLLDEFSIEVSLSGTTTRQPTGARGYKPLTTSPLADFDDAGEASSSGVMANLPSNTGQSSSSSSGSSPLGSNNAHVALIEKQDTAATTSSLRSRTDNGRLTPTTEVEAGDHM
jgi:hypothetical protein